MPLAPVLPFPAPVPLLLLQESFPSLLHPSELLPTQSSCCLPWSSEWQRTTLKPPLPQPCSDALGEYSPDFVCQLYTLPVLHRLLIQLQHRVKLLQTCLFCWATYREKRQMPVTHCFLKHPHLKWGQPAWSFTFQWANTLSAWDKVINALSELLHELPMFPGVQWEHQGTTETPSASCRSTPRGGSHDPAPLCASI